MNNIFKSKRAFSTLAGAVIAVSLALFSCRDNSSGQDEKHIFVLTPQQANVVAYIGAPAYASFAITRMNNSNEPIILTSDPDTSFFITYLHVTNDNAFVVALIAPNANAKQGNYVLKFTASAGNDVQTVSVPITLKAIPRFSHLISDTPDTIALKVNSYQDIRIIPIDSSGGTIQKSFFDSLGVEMVRYWAGSNSRAITETDQSNTKEYIYRLTAISLFPDTTDSNPVQMNFTLASKARNIFVFVHN